MRFHAHRLEFLTYLIISSSLLRDSMIYCCLSSILAFSLFFSSSSTCRIILVSYTSKASRSSFSCCSWLMILEHRQRQSGHVSLTLVHWQIQSQQNGCKQGSIAIWIFLSKQIWQRLPSSCFSISGSAGGTYFSYFSSLEDYYSLSVDDYFDSSVIQVQACSYSVNDSRVLVDSFASHYYLNSRSCCSRRAHVSSLL